VKPENHEEAPGVNAMNSNQEETVMPKRSQTTTLENPQEGAVEYVTNKP
jgi:hypothetical protein